MKNKERQILKQAEAILGRQRAEKLAQETTEKRKLIGNCYRYRNSYSCPGPDDYWWLFVKITGVEADGTMRWLHFQTDKDGKIEIEPNRYAFYPLDEKYERITQHEFDAALANLKKSVHALA